MQAVAHCLSSVISRHTCRLFITEVVQSLPRCAQASAATTAATVALRAPVAAATVQAQGSMCRQHGCSGGSGSVSRACIRNHRSVLGMGSAAHVVEQPWVNTGTSNTLQPRCTAAFLVLFTTWTARALGVQSVSDTRRRCHLEGQRRQRQLHRVRHRARRHISGHDCLRA